MQLESLLHLIFSLAILIANDDGRSSEINNINSINCSTFVGRLNSKIHFRLQHHWKLFRIRMRVKHFKRLIIV